MDKSVITAGTLLRNDRVVINHDEMPYLVDAVNEMPGGTVRVTYSSGDVIEYALGDELTIIDCT